MPKVTSRKQRAKAALMWVYVKPEHRAKLKAYTAKLEDGPTEFPYKLTVNRVASNVLAEAVERL